MAPVGAGQKFQKEETKPKTAENVAMQKTFKNTQLCKFNAMGKCTRGESCTFAHEATLLRQMPDFSKTRLCKTFMRTGFCEAGPACSFAHGRREQKKARSNPGLEAPASPARAKQAAEPAVPGMVVFMCLPTQPFLQGPKVDDVDMSSDAGSSTADGSVSLPPFSKQASEASPCSFSPTRSQTGSNSDFWIDEEDNSNYQASGYWAPEQGSDFEHPIKKDNHAVMQESPNFWEEHGISIRNTFIDVMQNDIHGLRRVASAPAL